MDDFLIHCLANLLMKILKELLIYILPLNELCGRDHLEYWHWNGTTIAVTILGTLPKDNFNKISFKHVPDAFAQLLLTPTMTVWRHCYSWEAIPSLKWHHHNSMSMPKQFQTGQTLLRNWQNPLKTNWKSNVMDYCTHQCDKPCHLHTGRDHFVFSTCLLVNNQLRFLKVFLNPKKT